MIFRRYPYAVTISPRRRCVLQCAAGGREMSLANGERAVRRAASTLGNAVAAFRGCCCAACCQNTPLQQTRRANRNRQCEMAKVGVKGGVGARLFRKPARQRHAVATSVLEKAENRRGGRRSQILLKRKEGAMPATPPARSPEAAVPRPARQQRQPARHVTLPSACHHHLP